MNEREPNIEADPSSKVATEIAEAINGFFGTHKWSGNKPFEVKMANQKEQIAHIYQIRKGEDWITIQERVSNNPSLVRTFNLDKKDDKWTYTDPYLIKYGESSLDKLQTVFDRLKSAIETSAHKQFGNTKGQLPSNET
jgi:hypothetical protein